MSRSRRLPLILSVGLPVLIGAGVFAGGVLSGSQSNLLLAAGCALLAVLALFTGYLWQAARRPTLQPQRSSLPPLPPAIGGRAPHGSEGSCCGHCQN